MASGLQGGLPQDAASAELFHNKKRETAELASESFGPIVGLSSEVLTTRRGGAQGSVATVLGFASDR